MRINLYIYKILQFFFIIIYCSNKKLLALVDVLAWEMKTYLLLHNRRKVSLQEISTYKCDYFRFTSAIDQHFKKIFINFRYIKVVKLSSKANNINVILLLGVLKGRIHQYDMFLNRKVVLQKSSFSIVRFI